MRKTISIIGGGASSLMLACELDCTKFDINLYEKNNALGRKFLVAGDGGLNLTHSESPTEFIKQYTPYGFIEKAFQNFSNEDFTAWINELGIKTFIGTSGRVFPVKEYKPITVLNAIISKLKNNKVQLLLNHEWRGFSKNNNLLFENNNELNEVKSDYTIFGLGGASWPITGSLGDWLSYFTEKKIKILPFNASNCAFKINWDEAFLKKIEGKTLKNISVSCNTKTHFGEVVLTKFGIEGSGIYPLSPQIREQIQTSGNAIIYIDFKPSLNEEKISAKLNSIIAKPRFTENLKETLNLSPLQIHLLKQLLNKEEFLNLKVLSQRIKKFPLTLTNLAPIDEAISTVGGISLTEITPNFELKKLTAHFAIGEMLDYDAPTGGYLLQSCFSMGKHVANYLNKLG
ncbi:MAG: TIGR03862 family flavoprotein [Bacteroidota bacterium]|nr:TIGR03862 family flavoprotein [Bacteroidota bacterium]